MKVLLYHQKFGTSPEIAVQRAQRRARRFRKTIWWDAGTLLFIIAAAVWLHPYAVQLSQIPMLRCFLPITTSVWEQCKLLCYPAFLVTVPRYLTMGDLQKGILTTCAEGLLQAISLLIAGLFTVQGIIGSRPFWLETAMLCACGVFLTWYLYRRADHQKHGNLLGMILLLLMEGALIWFTAYPPDLGLFSA